jgi:hypothetical protein
MKRLTYLLAGAALASSAAFADVIDFGGFAGQNANNAAPAGVSFDYSALVQNVDGNGDVIPGSFSWQIDAGAPPVTVQLPAPRGHGNGPAGLDAVDQTVLLTFSIPQNLVDFSGILDHGPLPGKGSGVGGGIPDHELVFLDANNKVISTQSVDFTVPGNNFHAGPVNGVKSIVLPSDRYYEKLTFTSVPEVNGSALVGMLILGGAFVARRARR